MPLLEIRYDWVPVKDIVVPEDRYWSRMDPEDYESLREAVKRLGEDFSRLNPVKVATSRADGRLMLIDGANRLKAFKELGLERIFSIIAVYGSPEEAGEEARWGSVSENWIRAQRDPAQLIRLIRRWTEGMERGQAVEVICRHTNYTRRYANMLLDIAGDEEIFRRVIEEGLSIHRAVELLKEKRKVYIEETVSGENEKPKIKEISAKEAIVEEIEPTRKSPKDISAKKPSFGEIFERAVRGAERELKRRLSGTIRSEMRQVLEALGIQDEDDMRIILVIAGNVLGKEDSETQKRAIWEWKRRVEEWGGRWMSVSLLEVLEEVKSGAPGPKSPRKGVEKVERVEAGAGSGRAAPAAALEEEEVVEGAGEGAAEAEAGEAGPPPSREYMEARREALIRRRREAERLVMELLAQEFPWAGDPIHVIERIYDVVDEAGPMGALIAVRLAMPRLMQVLKPPPRRLAGMLGYLHEEPGDLFYRRRDEAAEAIREAYRGNRDRILDEVARLREEEARMLLEVLKAVQPMVLGPDYSKLFLYIVPEARMPGIVIAGDNNIRVRAGDAGGKGEKLVRLQEALANMRFLGFLGAKNRPGAAVKEARVEVVQVGGVGLLRCPGCGEIARDPYTGLPFSCGNCGWPAPPGSVVGGPARRDGEGVPRHGG